MNQKFILKVAKIAALFALFIAMAGVSAYLTLTLIIKSEDTVIVPKLVGKDVLYALELLSDLGLNTKVKGTDYSPVVAKNHIIFQHPAAGTELKKGRDIRIVVSKGSQNILMPNLHGLAVQKARIILDENDLCHTEISKSFSETIAKDNIIQQVPPPGVTVSRGNCVKFLISLGPRPIRYKMPKITGRELEQAVLFIENHRFLIGKIDYRFQANLTPNSVTSQNPPSGYPVHLGQTVNMVANRVPEATSDGNDLGYRADLVQHRAAYGFLKQRIRINVNLNGLSIDLYDSYTKPGESIWLIIPDNSEKIRLYENELLVETGTGLHALTETY
ncbi:MAG: PASTA domain-containing protein [Desulfobacterales bacterium]|nr:PASTA domain-containing protein [Desulfobacterales bacterium]MDJ0914654.1 PASTA domain-containing protein [Desulfobacterales bacterium]